MVSEALQLKRASEVLVKSLGGIEHAASLLNKGKSVVGRWVNRNEPDHWFNLRDLREAEANAPDPVVTKALCRMAGGVFVPNVDLGADEGTLGFFVMRMAKELGDVSGEIAAALADGVVDPGEAARALGQLEELTACCAQLRGVLMQISNGERA